MDVKPLSGMTRQVLARARSEAFFFHHDQIQPEDMLAAIVGLPHCHAARLLRKLEVNLHFVMREIVAAKGFGPVRKKVLDPGLSAASTRVLERAAEESRALSAEFIGTEHVLLGLLREESVASHILANRLGVQADEVRCLAKGWAGVPTAEDPAQGA
ncbi:MAG: hypothetical protein F4X83_11545 [Chloroflexi bacterium]|nr:hypothetical protein [Chloroflexota bacterium]